MKGMTMKRTLAILVLVLAQGAFGAPAAGPPAPLMERLVLESIAFGTANVYTNVDGIVLGLEFATNRIVAGERLYGRMTVSNASPVEIYLHRRISRDAEIGDFVVTD